MPSYRVEALAYSKDPDLEDELEKRVLTFLYDNDLSAVNVVAYKVDVGGFHAL